jgi:ElaB/YqjD/DUF883 family membrane-anchored ribosome-binding protein
MASQRQHHEAAEMDTSRSEHFPGGATIGEQITTKVDELKERAEDVGETLLQAAREATHRLDDKRETVADNLDDLSKRFNGGAAALGKVAGVTSKKLQTTADYIRENELSGMLEDVQGVVRRYPAQSIAVALIAGLLMGKVLSNRS